MIILQEGRQVLSSSAHNGSKDAEEVSLRNIFFLALMSSKENSFAEHKRLYLARVRRKQKITELTNRII